MNHLMHQNVLTALRMRLASAMQSRAFWPALLAAPIFGVLLLLAAPASLAAALANNQAGVLETNFAIDLGVRPQVLIDTMVDDELKQNLQSCQGMNAVPTRFSIGHRGAPLRYPEHTRESYIAAARMGAGVLECDVTFTRDRVLVCRHAQCDLHNTTDILDSPLAGRCKVPPKYNAAGVMINTSSVRCCTSDLSLTEFKTLKGKMDTSSLGPAQVASFMDKHVDWNRDLLELRGTLMTHAESIALFDQLGVDFTPELKSPEVSMPFQGDYSQQDYASALLEEYKAAKIDPSRVWPQSFNYSDIQYWLRQYPQFAKQAVLLDGQYNPKLSASTMAQWFEDGLRVLAPPMWVLLDVDREGRIVSSAYARNAKRVGLNLMTWTVERSGLISNGGGWYFQSLKGLDGSSVIEREGDVFRVLHALAQDVGVQGVFSDWPATTSYYANCFGLD